MEASTASRNGRLLSSVDFSEMDSHLPSEAALASAASSSCSVPAVRSASSCAVQPQRLQWTLTSSSHSSRKTPSMSGESISAGRTVSTQDSRAAACRKSYMQYSMPT